MSIDDISLVQIKKNNISYLFLQYFRPIWYFNLMINSDCKSPWPNYELLSPEEKQLVVYDQGYSHPELSKWDASYQALLNGVITTSEYKVTKQIINIYPNDLYRFYKKYYKNIWLVIIFFQRILSFYNPLYEFIGLYKTVFIQKYSKSKKYCGHDKYNFFNSSILKLNPMVEIIIPTYKRYHTLVNVLKDLQNQKYKNFKVIIIDQNRSFSKSFYDRFNLKYKIIRQGKPGLWKARNKAILNSSSSYLLFLDDDSRVRSDWILEHIKCIDYFKSDISSGVSISLKGDKVPFNYYYFRRADQIDTGNVLIKRKVFEKCGLFDEQFEGMRMGDGEFGARAYLNAFSNISNPNARREHIKAAYGGLRSFGKWDGFYSLKLFSPRPIPSVLYYWRKYWGNKDAVVSCLLNLPMSIMPYRFKKYYFAKIVSILLFFLLFPVILIQLISSWLISTKMLNKGAIIKQL